MPSLTADPDTGKRHIHSYERLPGGKLWRCLHPACSHTAKRYEVKGKESYCGSCSKAIVFMTYENMRRARPRCTDCSTTRKALRHKDLVGKLGDLGI